MDSSTISAGLRDKESPEIIAKRAEDWRYIYFIPMAEYLSKDSEVFPELELFQIGPTGPVSEQGHRIQNIRTSFIRFLRDTEAGSKFTQEMEMINSFISLPHKWVNQ
jgi:hypothetical protein